jgi:NitT/TauT family transport system substrate-binding protein
MKRAFAATLTAVMALTVAACSNESGGSDDPTDAPTSDNPPAQETYDIRVAALPIAETGALWAAIDEGIFEDHGINIEIVPAQGGAQAIPALNSGDIDFAIGQPFGTFRADQADLGIVIISDYASSLATGKDVNGVVALESSGISSPADLAGKRVAVNSLGAAGDATIMKAVEDDGGDPATIEFVEVGFPDAQAQLEAGNIDAAWVPDPFMSRIAGNGGVIVVHNYQATIPGLTVLVNITTQDNLDNNPDMVAAYAAAMEEALVWAADNEQAVRDALVTNLEIPEEAAAGITLPTFTSEIKQADLEALAQIAVDYGVLEAMPNLDRILQTQ